MKKELIIIVNPKFHYINIILYIGKLNKFKNKIFDFVN